MVEACLHRFGPGADAVRIDYAVRQMEQWYVGDGQYADGPEFRFDYYNSFVIHPFLLDILATVHRSGRWSAGSAPWPSHVPSATVRSSNG
jgi:hypothetical protein